MGITGRLFEVMVAEGSSRWEGIESAAGLGGLCGKSRDGIYGGVELVVSGGSVE
jgi:bacterioferritin-associated ferredoxin